MHRCHRAALHGCIPLGKNIRQCVGNPGATQGGAQGISGHARFLLLRFPFKRKKMNIKLCRITHSGDALTFRIVFIQEATRKALLIKLSAGETF
jgi:hypothetical protein